MRSANKIETYSWWLCFILFFLSRLWSTIYYIEDVDSLRFALAVKNYDITKYQPHFPAYPVFCFCVKILYTLTGRYTFAFSTIGGLSTHFIFYFLIKSLKIAPHSRLGVIVFFLIFLNPLLWIMANRYMPDIMGCTWLIACLYYLSNSLSAPPSKMSRVASLNLGFFLTGILIGIRLSYAPFLLPILIFNLIRFDSELTASKRLFVVGYGILGIVVWLIPLVVITGFNDLILLAKSQSQGHFSDYGGTIITEPDFKLRFLKLFESIWADGFGLYWSQRDSSTLVSTVALVLVCLLLVFNLIQASPTKINLQKHKAYQLDRKGNRRMQRPFYCMPLLCCLSYLVWIFFFQNVVHKSRHILPLLPFLTIAVAYVIEKSISLTNRYGGRIMTSLALIVWLFSSSYVSLHLAMQHKRPTAIAQMLQFLRSSKAGWDRPFQVISVPLIKYYLLAQELEVDYISVKSEKISDLADQLEVDANWFVIGSPMPEGILKQKTSSLGNGRKELKSVYSFYHNPYVNRMWSKLNLYLYVTE